MEFGKLFYLYLNKIIQSHKFFYTSDWEGIIDLIV